MRVTLHHETAPAIALSVARSKRCLAGPILSDSGLNVEIVGHAKGPFHQGQAECRGARLTFEWDGPIAAAHEAHGYPPDVLYDHHPHRGFVPVGTSKHLHLCGVTLMKGRSWTEAVFAPEFSVGMPVRAFARWIGSRLPGWTMREALRIEREVSQIVAGRPQMRVVFPPENVYEGHLRERFPHVSWPE